MRHNDLPDILLIDKPKGVTSFDVIRQLRRALGSVSGARLKMGHAGTLDPLATGLLVIGIEKGTKKLNEFLKLSKTYEATVLLGIATDTGDMDGRVLCEKHVGDISAEEMRKVLAGLVGTITLPVPAYSAVKQKGEPLYKKARRGERVLPPRRKMEIKKMVLARFQKEVGKMVLGLVMEVGSGAYVRSIAEEIGRRLGVPAAVAELRRTKVGEFRVEDARRISEL